MLFADAAEQVEMQMDVSSTSTAPRATSSHRDADGAPRSDADRRAARQRDEYLPERPVAALAGGRQRVILAIWCRVLVGRANWLPRT